MNPDCPRCGHHNPGYARYCGACGSKLLTRAVKVGNPHRTNLVLVLAVVAVGWMVIIGPPRIVRKVRNMVPKYVRPWWGEIRERGKDAVASFREETLDVTGPRADDIYNLLAPNDIGVVVGRKGSRLFVRGSTSEIRAVKSFGELLEGNVPESHFRQRVTVHNGTQMIRKVPVSARVKLKDDKREMLTSVLRRHHVPVKLSLRPDNFVVISADKEAWDRLEPFLKILNGERF